MSQKSISRSKKLSLMQHNEILKQYPLLELADPFMLAQALGMGL